MCPTLPSLHVRNVIMPDELMQLHDTCVCCSYCLFSQVLVVGLLSFWGGLWLMAIKWAGVAPAHLGLSRVTPTLTVCLELMCLGA